MAKTPEIDLRDAQIDDNLLMNGRLNFWQRGTSATLNLTTATGSGTIIADRFRSFLNRVTNNQNYTWSQQSDVPTFAQAGSNLPFSLRCTANLNHSFTGEDRIDACYQNIEGSFLGSIASNQKLYINFWFKSNVAIPVACVRLAVSSNGTSVTHSYVSTFNYTTANAWQKVSLAVDLPSVEFHKGTGVAVSLNLLNIAGSTSTFQTSTLNTWQAADKLTTPAATNWAAASSNWVQFAGLSITENAVESVPLAGKNYAEELRLCQRYYEKSYAIDVVPGTVVSGIVIGTFGNSGGAHGVGIPFQVRKRSTPVVTIYNPDTGAANLVAVLSAGFTGNANASASATDMSFNLSSGTYSATAASRQHFHFTADAEL